MSRPAKAQGLGPVIGGPGPTIARGSRRWTSIEAVGGRSVRTGGYGAVISDDDVILEGGERHGQPVSLSAMTGDGAGKYVLHDKFGVYRHDEQSPADFRNGQRIAVFEPAVADLDT